MTNTTIDLNVLIKIFDTNLRILKKIDIDSDRYIAGRIEELESTIRTLKSLRTIIFASNRVAEELDDNPEQTTVPDFTLEHEENGISWILNLNGMIGRGTTTRLRLFRYQLRDLRRMIDDELEKHPCRAE